MEAQCVFNAYTPFCDPALAYAHTVPSTPCCEVGSIDHTACSMESADEQGLPVVDAALEVYDLWQAQVDFDNYEYYNSAAAFPEYYSTASPDVTPAASKPGPWFGDCTDYHLDALVNHEDDDDDDAIALCLVPPLCALDAHLDWDCIADNDLGCDEHIPSNTDSSHTQYTTDTQVHQTVETTNITHTDASTGVHSYSTVTTTSTTQTIYPEPPVKPVSAANYDYVALHSLAPTQVVDGYDVQVSAIPVISIQPHLDMRSVLNGGRIWRTEHVTLLAPAVYAAHSSVPGSQVAPGGSPPHEYSEDSCCDSMGTPATSTNSSACPHVTGAAPPVQSVVAGVLPPLAERSCPHAPPTTTSSTNKCHKVPARKASHRTDCYCGGSYLIKNITTHFRSKKHQNYDKHLQEVAERTGQDVDQPVDLVLQ